MYSITAEDDAFQNNWEGTLTQMKKFVEQSTEKSKVSLEKKIEDLTYRVMDAETRESTQDRNIKDAFLKMRKQQTRDKSELKSELIEEFRKII